MDHKCRYKIRKTVLLAFMMVLVSGAFSASFAVETYLQEEWCLNPNIYSEVVENENFTVPLYEYERGSRTKKNTITTKRAGGKSVTFKTLYLLPMRYQAAHWGNPQSIEFSGDGRYLYVVYTEWQNSVRGWIVRYDLKLLKKYKISFKQLQTATMVGKSKLNKKMKKCIKVGKPFITGHGQGFAFNPVTKELWEIQDRGIPMKAGAYTTLQRINKNSLVPDAKIAFRLKSTVAMGRNLAFDSEGNAYFNTYTGGGNWPGSVKIYKGRISTKSVSFELISQGIRFNAGTHSQGLGYNSVSNRLVIISDGCIQSVPVGRLGLLNPEDVWQTTFSTKREFEGITFDREGYAYLICNRNSEVFKSTQVY
jgi:hypothetical protein